MPGLSVSRHFALQKTMLAVCLLTMVFLLLSVGIHQLTRNNILGSDFFVFYKAGQTIFIDHTNPYSDEVAREAQLAIFKRPALPNEDQLAFANPPYAILAIIPLLAFKFDWASALWASFNILAFIIVIIAAARRSSLWVPISSIFFYPISFGLILGNFDIIIATILIGCFLILTYPKDLNPLYQMCAGILLAWCTVKPQFSWIFILFFLVIAYRRRWNAFLISFFAGLLIFLSISFLLVPGWPSLWQERLLKYAQYNQSYPVIFIILREILGISLFPITAVCISALVFGTSILGKQWWHHSLGSLEFLAYLGLTGYLLHPNGKSYDQIMLLIPLILWTARSSQHSPILKIFFWSGNIALSWIFFFISTRINTNPIINEGLIIPITIWVVWLLITFFANKPTQQSIKQTSL